MANHISHAGLPYPVKHARFTLMLPYLDADGDPADGSATLDTELSIDNATWGDAAEEVTFATGGRGIGMITLTGAETNASYVGVFGGNGGAAKAPLAIVQPRVLPVIFSGTASAGGAAALTLASDCPALADVLVGCIIRTTGGAGGGGTGGANNQARVITAYTAGRACTVDPAWETATDGTTTYDILLTEASFLRLADVIASRRTVIPAPTTAGIPMVELGTVATTALLTAFYADSRAGVVRSGTCQASAAVNQVKLDASASAVDDFPGYIGAFCVVLLDGAIQGGTIIDYDGTSKVATLDRDLTAVTDTDDSFWIFVGSPGITAAVQAAANWAYLFGSGLGGLSAEEWARHVTARLLGNNSGFVAGAGTVVDKDMAGTDTNSQVVDADGNRSALDLTP